MERRRPSLRKLRSGDRNGVLDVKNGRERRVRRGMSTDEGNKPNDPNEGEQALPKPKYFVLSPVEDGNFKNQSPTVTAVYIGCEDYPPEEDLIKIDGGVLDRDELAEARLQLYLFLPPSDEQSSYEDTETFSYELAADKEIIDNFWDCVLKIKRFVFAVSTDTYYFTCRVNTETNQVVESNFEKRLLN